MKRYENKDKKPTSLLLKKSKKLPLNINEIDIDLIMSNPKTLHSFMDRDGMGASNCDETDEYVPTNANPDKLSNRPKSAREGRPYYFDEGLWGGKRPRKGQQFELENIAYRNEQKRGRKAEANLEKLRAMHSPDEKELKEDLRELAPVAKMQYGDPHDYTEMGKYINKGTRAIQDTVSSSYDKGKELIGNFISDVKVKGFGPTVMGHVDDGKDLINEFISRKEFDNVREHLKKPKKEEGKALNELLDRPLVHKLLNNYYEYSVKAKNNDPLQKITDYMTSTKKKKKDKS
jgi:hypothetical protein